MLLVALTTPHPWILSKGETFECLCNLYLSIIITFLLFIAINGYYVIIYSTVA